MKFTASSALLLAGSALAAPTESLSRMARRAAGITDADILNFALTLEHLENTFYMEALAKFPQAAFDAFGSTPRTRFNVKQISADETTHVDFLSAALTKAGATPVKPCTYDFGLTDVNSFLATSSVLEGVGVSAYLGAASAITEAAYLTAAGSILTVESRHSAYIRDNQKNPGPLSPFPAPFDKPLDLNQVYTLASAFITSCPADNPKLPVMAFPSLKVTMDDPAYLRAGETIKLEAEKAVSGTLYCAYPAVAGPYFTDATVDGTSVSCKIPDGVPGQSYVVLSKSGTAISDADTVAGPAVLTVQAPYTYPGFPM